MVADAVRVRRRRIGVGAVERPSGARTLAGEHQPGLSVERTRLLYQQGGRARVDHDRHVQNTKLL